MTASRQTVAFRVLIVDDDEYVREVMGRGFGHSIAAAGSGVEALRWLEEKPHDLLTLDLKMPEIDGPTLYREILARLNVPLLLKPFTLEELHTAVSRVLATV